MQGKQHRNYQIYTLLNKKTTISSTSDNAYFKGIVVNLALSSLLGRFLEITLTVLLSNLIKSKTAD